MVTLTIPTDEQLLAQLEKLAVSEDTTVEEIARQALQHYVQEHPVSPRTYSFIGIGHSGKGTLSVQAEEILSESADRREGWSLDQ
jgi:hypothetical protein